MPAMISADCTFDKWASLLASKARWNTVDDSSPDRSTNRRKTGDCKQDSIHQWLISSCQEDGKADSAHEATELLIRHISGEDDLVLGVEASLYGKNTALKTVQEFLRSQQVTPLLSRWNSITSAFSTHSAALSVMDVLNLWHDDPEELLLDLGFGCDEPDISVKIPARFINHPSKARGINIQVFLEAQKNRMDVENPDVSNRFRQLEVLQQVTSAFSSLVGGTPVTPSPGEGSGGGSGVNLPEGARERRKRLSMLFRRASKKTLSMAQSEADTPAPTVGHETSQDPGLHPTTSDRRNSLKRSRPGLPENGCLAPLVEEQSPPSSRDASDPPPETPMLQEGILRPRSGRDPTYVASSAQLRRKSPGELKTPESFEMEEIHSFDEGSVAGSVAGLAENAEGGVMRTNSCQSDSSGFLEEPFIPALSQQNSPVPELMKALYAMSGDSTDSQSAQKESPDLPCTSSQGHQGAPESALPADPKHEVMYEVPEREEEETSPGEGGSGTETDPELGVVPPAGEEEDSDKDTVTAPPVEDMDTCVTICDSQMAEGLAVREETAASLSHSVIDGAPSEGNSGIQAGVVTPEEEFQDSPVCSSGVDSSAEVALMALSGLETGAGHSQQEGSWGTSLPGIGRTYPTTDPAACQGVGSGSDPPSESAGAGSVGKKRPGLGSARSVSVQMPSSLGSVSQMAHRRAVVHPSTLRARRESFCRKAWSDAGQPRPSNLHQELAVAAAMETATTREATPPRRRHSLGSHGSSRTRSASLDTGLEQGDDEDDVSVGVAVGVAVGERWEQSCMSAGRCCCHCDRHRTCCCRHTHCPPGDGHSNALEILHYAASRRAAFPYSLDELEGMVRCMRKFRSVLEEMEERLADERAQVYGMLSDVEREDMRDIQGLRIAVKQEVDQLEMQLTDLTQHYDESLKTQMHRLLDEQSHLRAQLRILPSETPHLGPSPSSEAEPTSPSSGHPFQTLPVGPTPSSEATPTDSKSALAFETRHWSSSPDPTLRSSLTRSVAVQCCLLPTPPATDGSAPVDKVGLRSNSPQEMGGELTLSPVDTSGQNPQHKQERLDFVGFFESLKDSFRHSVNSDSLE